MSEEHRAELKLSCLWGLWAGDVALTNFEEGSSALKGSEEALRS